MSEVWEEIGAGHNRDRDAALSSASSRYHVYLDPSEYLLAGKIDGSGQAEVLLYLHVDVAPGFTQPVDLLRLEGGGVRVDSSHQIS